MKKILVMGGNQFVGKAITKKFLEGDNYVYVLNRGNRENLDGAHFLKADRNNIDEMKKVLKNINVDVIVDVSAYTQEHVRIIQEAMKNKFKHYILISSGAVYNNTKELFTEDSRNVGRNEVWGDYSENKFLAERETIVNSVLQGFKYTIFRPFYIYGIGNNLDRENYFFSRIKYNMPIYLPNQGDNLVQFGYIDDLVLAIEMSIENSDFYNQIFNISGDEYITMIAFVEICGKIMSKKSIIKYVDTKSSNLKARDWFPFRDVDLFGDISKIEATGFRNQYSLIKGLEETYKYNEENNLLERPILNDIEKSFGN